jgi:hypothetical protein
MCIKGNMKTKRQRIAHLLLVLVAAFSIFTGGLLLNAHPSYAFDIKTISAKKISASEAEPRGASQQAERLHDTGYLKQMQTALNANGANPPLSVDGIWGPITRDAAIAFEDKNGLPYDDNKVLANFLRIKYAPK